MSDIKITTNNHIRPIVSYWEMSDAERAAAGFEYAVDAEAEMPDFFRYRGGWWRLDDFSRLSSEIANGAASDAAFAGWDAAMGTSYFDAVVIRLKYDDYGDAGVVVGHATW